MHQQDKTSVSLAMLKILRSDHNWQWITDVRGVIDQGFKDEDFIHEKLGIEIMGGENGPAKLLYISRLDGELPYAFRAKKIYLCNGVTGSTIDCLLP